MVPAARLYLFDRVGYGQSPVNLEQDNVFLIGGRSDKVFDVLEAIENGGDALSAIEETEV